MNMKVRGKAKSNPILGINGLGRIGKLTLWHHVAHGNFERIVVNIGRGVGKSLADLAHYIESDSTYGSLHHFLHGLGAEPVITGIDDAGGRMNIDGIPVQFLTKARNPLDIPWAAEGVKLVADATGAFLDPTAPPDDPKGSVMGHIEAGAEKVIVSAPFKIKDKSKPMPDYAVTTVMGVNDRDYDPRRHKIVSAASCTTTCLAHMVKPLLDHFGAKRVLTASMATVHAATGTQAVLDRMPKAGDSDLRKSRGTLNNIILTSTGAAGTLALVIPEMKQIGFMAESVRIPTSTGSLIILAITLQDEPGKDGIRRERINNIYKKAAAADERGYLIYSDRQNVSADIIGHPRAGAIIEGHETHTRTAEIEIDVAALGIKGVESLRAPVTSAVIYGWYDNEYGGFVNMMGDRAASIAESMV